MVKVTSSARRAARTRRLKKQCVIANLLKHERFNRPPVILLKRKGRLPRGVASIKSVPRIKVGALAEIVTSRSKENNGIRVRIMGYDGKSAWCWECRSLDRSIRCNDGAMEKSAWFKEAQLRRLWTGNTTPSKAGVL